MLNKIKPLNILAPDIFEQCIGYQGAGKWIAIYLEPEINQTICSDGKTVVAAGSDIWSVLLSPLRTSTQFQELGLESQECLLLDRSSRVFYTAEQTTAAQLLQQPYWLDLYCSLNTKQDGKQPVKIALNKYKPIPELLNKVLFKLSSTKHTSTVVKMAVVSALSCGMMLLTLSLLSTVKFPVNATKEYNSALVQVAFNPSQENILGAIKTAFNPRLPYAEALILNQNKFAISAQKQLDFDFQIFGGIREIFILIQLAKFLASCIRKFGDWVTPFFQFLQLQVSVLYVNLLTALAVLSPGVAVIYFLITASFLMVFLTLNSIESIIISSTIKNT